MNVLNQNNDVWDINIDSKYHEEKNKYKTADINMKTVYFR